VAENPRAISGWLGPTEDDALPGTRHLPLASNRREADDRRI
jgi:hypothetical protein